MELPKRAPVPESPDHSMEKINISPAQLKKLRQEVEAAVTSKSATELFKDFAKELKYPVDTPVERWKEDEATGDWSGLSAEEYRKLPKEERQKIGYYRADSKEVKNIYLHDYADVLAVQAILKKEHIGGGGGVDDPGTLDGMWGPKTQAALLSWQKIFNTKFGDDFGKNIAEDGQFGPETFKAMHWHFVKEAALDAPERPFQSEGESLPPARPEAPAEPEPEPEPSESPGKFPLEITRETLERHPLFTTGLIKKREGDSSYYYTYHAPDGREEWFEVSLGETEAHKNMIDIGVELRARSWVSIVSIDLTNPEESAPAKVKEKVKEDYERLKTYKQTDEPDDITPPIPSRAEAEKEVSKGPRETTLETLMRHPLFTSGLIKQREEDASFYYSHKGPDQEEKIFDVVPGTTASNTNQIYILVEDSTLTVNLLDAAASDPGKIKERVKKSYEEQQALKEKDGREAEPEPEAADDESEDSPSEAAKLYSKEGDEALKKKDYKAAAAAFLRARSFDPSNQYAHFNLAYAYRESGDLEKANSTYKDYISRYPNDAEGYYGFAMTLERQGEWAAAANSYEKYAELETKPGRQDWIMKARAKAIELRKKAEAAGLGSIIDRAKDWKKARPQDREMEKREAGDTTPDEVTKTKQGAFEKLRVAPALKDRLVEKNGTLYYSHKEKDLLIYPSSKGEIYIVVGEPVRAKIGYRAKMVRVYDDLRPETIDNAIETGQRIERPLLHRQLVIDTFEK